MWRKPPACRVPILRGLRSANGTRHGVPAEFLRLLRPQWRRSRPENCDGGPHQRPGGAVRRGVPPRRGREIIAHGFQPWVWSLDISQAVAAWPTASSRECRFVSAFLGSPSPVMPFWTDGPVGPNNHSPRIHPWGLNTPTPIRFPRCCFPLPEVERPRARGNRQRACGFDRHPWMNPWAMIVAPESRALTLLLRCPRPVPTATKCIGDHNLWPYPAIPSTDPGPFFGMVFVWQMSKLQARSFQPWVSGGPISRSPERGDTGFVTGF